SRSGSWAVLAQRHRVGQNAEAGGHAVSLPQAVIAHRTTGDYRKLVNALALRAARMGSRDPEGAAQEAVRRSLANSQSRPPLEYYFHESPGALVPAWTLLQLLGWLHGVLRLVVREEHARARTHHEAGAAD